MLGAALAATAVLEWQRRAVADPHVVYDRHNLPAFDAYVYVGMAEQPGVFTVAPWGWRVLTPALAAAVPTRNVARAFRVVNGLALVAAALLAFFAARRLGVRPWIALLAAPAFAAAPPVREAVRYVFLVEPLTVALELALVVASLAPAGPGLLALIAVAGVLSKEFFLVLLPLVFLLRAPTDGPLRAGRDAVLVAAPAVLAAVALRTWWTPHIATPLPAVSPATLLVALHRFHDSWPEWWSSLLLGGLGPLALLGALRRRAEVLLWPALYTPIAVLVPPLLNPVGFFPSDIPRLLIYALPVAAPLAVVALEPARLAPGPRAGPWLRGMRRSLPEEGGVRRADVVLLAGAVLLALLPLALLDRYRRADLSGPRDGPWLLATVRETARVARHLERGETVELDPARRRFAWGTSHPSEMERMRWYLRSGWGERAHYGTGEVRLHDTEGTLLLPRLGGRATTVAIGLGSAAPARVSVAVNGQVLDRWTAGADAAPRAVAVPAGLLFRGDNVVEVRADAPGVRLVTLSYSGGP